MGSDTGNEPWNLPAALVAEALGTSVENLRGYSFLELGGSSLDAVRVQVDLRRQHRILLPTADILRAPDLRALLDEAVPDRSDPAPPRADPPPGSTCPLTWQQRLIWYQALLHPASPRYLFHAAFHFDDPPEISALRQELALLLRRHPILRTRLVTVDGEPYQLLPPADVAPAELDVREMTVDGRIRPTTDVLASVDHAIDLERGPLMRWTLVHGNDGRATLLHTEHHIVHDGRSFVTLLRTLAGRPGDEPDLGYFRFAADQHPPRPGAADRVADRCRNAALNLFSAGPVTTSTADHFLRLPVPPTVTATVRAAARRAGVSMFTVLFTAFGQALARHLEASEIVVGTAVANRPAGHEDTVGMFVATVPVPVRRQGAEPAGAVLARTDAALAEAIDDAPVPLTDVVHALGGAAGRGDDVLIQAAFSMHEQVVEDVELAGRSARVEVGLFNGAAKFPVNVIVVNRGTGPESALEVLFEGAGSRVGYDDLWALWTYMIQWLRDWAPWQQTEPDRSPAGNLVARVSAHAAGRGGDPALHDDLDRFTYAELVRLGETARRAGWAGRTIGVLGEASAAFFACAYSALHAGGTYVPLDRHQPSERLRHMVEQAGCDWVIDINGDRDGSVAAPPPDGPPVLCWSDLTAGSQGGPVTGTDGAAGDAAYVMFTSGSTGAPKGVVVARSSLDELAAFAADELELGPGVVVGQTANVGFDASAWEVWPALYAGAAVCVTPAAERSDPGLLADWLTSRRVHCLFLPTPLAELFMRLPTVGGGGLTVLSAGGDRLHPIPSGLPYRVMNCYGPTETVIVAAVDWVEPGGSEPPPIGRVLPYGYGRTVTPDGSEVAPGEAGELWVGGAGVALGYIGDPALTAARFVPDPYSPDCGTVYRTGDIVRRRDDGRMDFLGRRDRQVKVSGVRLELGEVEAVVSTRPGVHQVAAEAVEERGATRLRLFVVPEPGHDRAEVERSIRTAVPPAARHLTIRFVATLPVTANGKVDRRRLAGHDATPPVPPADPVELLWPAVSQLSTEGKLALAGRLVESVTTIGF